MISRRHQTGPGGRNPFAVALIVLVMLCLTAGAALAGLGMFEINSWERMAEDPERGAVSLKSLEAEIEIDGGFAQVRLRQTFQNHTGRTIGGTYYLRLPEDAVMMDFGVWDAGKWTEAVVMEKREAKRTFNDVVARMVDPGLLESPEADFTDGFRVSLAPLAPWATARAETVYHHWLKIRALERRFILPLKPGAAANAERVDHLQITVRIKETLPAGTIVIEGPIGANFTTSRQEEGEGGVWSASFEGGPIDLDHDLTVTVPLAPSADELSVITYRDPVTETLDLSPTGGQTYRDESGYFLAEALFNHSGAGDTAAPLPPRDVALLFDTSFSMGEEKLARAAEVLSGVLAGLSPEDRFTLITMDLNTAAWKDSPAPADAEAKIAASRFLRGRPLSAGTGLEGGLRAAFTALSGDGDGRRRQVVAITDGRATLGSLDPEQLLGEGRVVPVHVFGVGEDTDARLLESLTRASGGYFIWGRESEDLNPKRSAFEAALREEPFLGVNFLIGGDARVTDVYPATGLVGFNRESLSWVGRYLAPQAEAVARVSAAREGLPVETAKKIALPESAPANSFVARMWAERRVEYLLGLIREEGEKDAYVNEIIALSRRFKFPTPYTSYLVAPRAFLRPRILRPRDPVLTVKAPADTRSVIALFPFGEVHHLRFAAEFGVWETRFLVPEGTPDGRYFCRLILTGQNGGKIMEFKEFIVDSRPPRLRLHLPEKPARPGTGLEILVDADPDTREINATLEGLPPVPVRWDEKTKMNRGRVLLPPGWPPGEYSLTLTARDFAHNVTRKEARVRIGG